MANEKVDVDNSKSSKRQDIVTTVKDLWLTVELDLPGEGKCLWVGKKSKWNEWLSLSSVSWDEEDEEAASNLCREIIQKGKIIDEDTPQCVVEWIVKKQLNNSADGWLAEISE